MPSLSGATNVMKNMFFPYLIVVTVLLVTRTHLNPVGVQPHIASEQLNTIITTIKYKFSPSVAADLPGNGEPFTVELLDDVQKSNNNESLNHNFQQIKIGNFSTYQENNESDNNFDLKYNSVDGLAENHTAGLECSNLPNNQSTVTENEMKPQQSNNEVNNRDNNRDHHNCSLPESKCYKKNNLGDESELELAVEEPHSSGVSYNKVHNSILDLESEPINKMHEGHGKSHKKSNPEKDIDSRLIDGMYTSISHMEHNHSILEPEFEQVTKSHKKFNPEKDAESDKSFEDVKKSNSGEHRNSILEIESEAVAEMHEGNGKSHKKSDPELKSSEEVCDGSYCNVPSNLV